MQIGPNVLLEILLDTHKTERKDVGCENSEKDEQTHCWVIKEKIHRLDYYFDERDGMTMIPFKIQESLKEDDQFKAVKQFNYFKFTPSFSKNYPTVNRNLPIG